MAIKKSQLYASLWANCNALRDNMDASQRKDYILTLLFMKYVSDKAAKDPYSTIEVPEGGSFADMIELIGNKEIGEKINIIIRKFTDKNPLLKGVIDQTNFDDETKLGKARARQDILSKMIRIFDNLDLSSNRAEGDDLLGDAYEYLMQRFSAQSGKSKGSYYTPAEVSRVMAKVIGISQDTPRSNTIYDPTCGSGSLLLKAADEAPHGLSISGQEKDNSTYALAKMNMILHNHAGAEIRQGNTLASPAFTTDDQLTTFDFAVANPPFSDKAWISGLNPSNDEYNRFEFGVPPTNGDYAFLLHFIKSLKSKGKGAIILPHGVLFRGNKEADIRRNIIRHGYIKGIIGLPPNLFYGTGIPACIIVIDKENASHRTGIFMIDASKDFIKDGNKNRLRAQDIHKIVSAFNAQQEIDHYSRMVPTSEIVNSTDIYNLNIPRYIDTSETEDLHNLDAHLNGGIPDTDIKALEKYWQIFPTLRQELFIENGRPGYSDPKVETHLVKQAILTHDAFKAYKQDVTECFETWQKTHEPLLHNISVGTTPRDIIDTLSEDMLVHFADLPLIDPYDMYQKLMNYWDEVMQDDLYLILSNSWMESAKPQEFIPYKKLKETPDLTIKKKKYRTDLIPPALIIASYYAKEQAQINKLQSALETAEQVFKEYVEEHTGDYGMLADATTAAGNVTKDSIKARLKALTANLMKLNNTEVDDEELETLEHCLTLIDAKSKASKAVKDAELALNIKVLNHYRELTESQIKKFVIMDKWFASIQAAVDSVVQQMIQKLTERVQELEERYAQPLPALAHDVQEFSMKVDKHLSNMGVAWHE